MPQDLQGKAEAPSDLGRSGEEPSKGEHVQSQQQGGSGGGASGCGSSGVGGGSGGSGGDQGPPPPWKHTDTLHDDPKLKPEKKKKKQQEEEGEGGKVEHAGGDSDDDEPKPKPRKEEEKHDGGERDGEDAGKQAGVGEREGEEEGGIGQMAEVDSGLHLRQQASANHSHFTEEVGDPQNTSIYVYIIPKFKYNQEPAEGHYAEYYAPVLFSPIEQMRPLLLAFPGLASHPNSPNQSLRQSSSSPSPPLSPVLLPRLSPWQSPHDSAVSSQSHSNSSASFSSSLSHNSLGAEETRQPESDTEQAVLPPPPGAHPGQQPNTTVQPSPPSPESSQENGPIPFQSLAGQTNSDIVHSSESLHEWQ